MRGVHDPFRIIVIISRISKRVAPVHRASAVACGRLRGSHAAGVHRRAPLLAARGGRRHKCETASHPVLLHGRREVPVGADATGARRICHLTDFDGSLCAAVDVRHEINKYVFFTQSGGSWTVRCCIDSQSLTPRATSDEFMEERDVVPLCSAAGGKVMLATGRHKVFAYDPERRVMERVFYAREFVDVSRRHRDDARLRLSFVLHEEHIHQPSSLRVQQGEKKLQVKLGSNDTVDKREVVDEHRDDHFRRLGDFFKQMAGLPLPPHMTNSQPNY
ncbi:hypothetical protein PR202_ga24816 [Eleusine coracana subsp. coracana]|uniref:Uncharacterized protein n=1 Tax=Eleusine coracana subsp. coracana TaxID=191504 RepID=A0AAV5D9S5_ELECO|nr:hypothetical protein PR202_ga24816 [Eleusine coracana subsp. coracana]